MSIPARITLLSAAWAVTLATLLAGAPQARAQMTEPSLPSACSDTGTSTSITSVSWTGTAIRIEYGTITGAALGLGQQLCHPQADSTYKISATGSQPASHYSGMTLDYTSIGGHTIVADTDYWVRLESFGYGSDSPWIYIRTSATGPAITIAAGTSPVTEGTNASFTVTADSAPDADLTVDLTVSESAGSDYVASGDEGSKTVTIAANTTTATYSVTTQADTTDEPNGSVTVTVAAGTDYSVGTASSASVTVNDDDALVSNIGQANNGSNGSFLSLDFAQGFTTGARSDGYTLESIEVKVAAALGSNVAVNVRKTAPGVGGSAVATLTHPSSLAAGNRTFTAPSGTVLARKSHH